MSNDLCDLGILAENYSIQEQIDKVDEEEVDLQKALKYWSDKRSEMEAVDFVEETESTDGWYGVKTDTDAQILTKLRKAAKLNFFEVESREKKYLLRLQKEGTPEPIIQYMMKDNAFSYLLSFEQLWRVDIKELLRERERDSYWIVDFVKNLVYEIRKDADSEYRIVGGECVKAFNNRKSEVLKRVKRILRLKDDEFGLLFLKVVGKYYDQEQAVDASSLTLVLEEDLKKELLETRSEELKQTFDSCTDEELLDYHIYHFQNREEAAKIFYWVRKVFEEGKTLEDIEKLTVENDWEMIIRGFLGIDEVEEVVEDIRGDEDWSFTEDELKDKIKELEEEGDSIERKHIQRKVNKNNSSKAVKIQNKETGEVVEFETVGDAIKYLNTTWPTWGKFAVGLSKLSKHWKLVN